MACFAIVVLRAPVARSASLHGPMPKHWSARLSTPHGWYQQALCVHSREGAWNASTGNGYEGGLQFLLSTWLSVGGPVQYFRFGGIAHWASVVSPKEQLYRAFLVWRRDGGSWREWGTARGCGLR